MILTVTEVWYYAIGMIVLIAVLFWVGDRL